MNVEISDLPMFEELCYARKHAEELSQGLPVFHPVRLRHRALPAGGA